MARPRSWSDEDLRHAVATATSWSAVARGLALAPGGHTNRLLRERAAALELDVTHFRPDWRPRPPIPVVVEGTSAWRRARFRRWSDEDLLVAVPKATSWAGLHRELGLKIGGTTYPMLQERCRELGLDTSHFTGRGWRKGDRRPPPGVWRPLEEILVQGSTYSSHKLRLRLISEGFKPARCEGCAGTAWRGRPIPLQLDHINGNRRDNRLENLRILCPNCHAQTDTWCSKNRAG
jgi:hypothetical protein